MGHSLAGRTWCGARMLVSPMDSMLFQGSNLHTSHASSRRAKELNQSFLTEDEEQTLKCNIFMMIIFKNVIKF